jgi:hypothetical protein
MDEFRLLDEHLMRRSQDFPKRRQSARFLGQSRPHSRRAAGWSRPFASSLARQKIRHQVGSDQTPLKR